MKKENIIFMEIINIFKRSQYLICFLFFLIELLALFFYQDYVKNKTIIIVYKIIFAIILIHYLYCIVLESEFKSHYLKILQIHFEKYLSIVSLITTLSMVINMTLYFFLFLSMGKFFDNCHFYMNKLHSEKKCELYNINENTKNPYQFICVYNPETDQIPRELSYINESSINCSESELLLSNDNVVIEEFKPKYNGSNFYYCDLKFEPENFFLMEEHKCNISKKGYFKQKLTLLHLLYINLAIIYFVLINVYFRNIKANVINIVIVKYD